MFRSYITTSIRNLKRYKWYSILNIVGLALGISCSALILFYVIFELSFDSYHSKEDRIYRVYKKEPGRTFLGSDYFAVIPAPAGKAMESDFPEVESSVKISEAGESVVGLRAKLFLEKEMYYSEPSIFKIFDFPLIQGDYNTALAEPYSVVLSKEMADKYFGNENPIGKTVRFKNKYDLKITGVLKEISQNSNFIPKILISFSTLEAITEDKGMFSMFSWTSSSFHTFILLKQNASVKTVEAKLPLFVNKYLGKLFAQWGRKEPTQYFLQPLKDIHLYSANINFDNLGDRGDTKSIYILTGLALIILLTACINYMNLSTARSSLRAKEVGIRKVIGAHRIELIKQFLGESLIITSIATFLATIIILLALPKFSELVERKFSVSLITTPSIILGFIFISAIVGIIAGSYPAFVLSSFKPAYVIKGESRLSSRSKFRNALVVIQFSAAVTLIICSAVILTQLKYIRSGSMGYQRDNIVALKLHYGESDREKAELLKESLLKNSNIAGVTGTYSLPIDIGSQTSVSGISENKNKIKMLTYLSYADYDFLNVYKIPLVKGRNFSKDYSDESGSYIVNETFVKKFGWTQPIGQTFILGEEEVKVIGVVKDFHMYSIHNQISPLFIKLNKPSQNYFLSVRIHPEDLTGSLAFIKKTWSQLIPEVPIDFSFLDENFEKMYVREESLSEIVSYFTFFAIIITSLGLLGISAFIIEQRKKEIGIRKVLGAKISEVVLLLSKEFLILVIIANLIAFPLGYFFMTSWLKDFAYKIDISWWIFILACVISLMIALATVSIQAIKAAKANPVESLRYE